MKTLRVLLSLALLTLLLTSAARAGEAEAETYTFGIEMGGVLCGYSEITASVQTVADRDVLVVKQHLFLMISALGSRFNTDIRLLYHVDVLTGNYVRYESVVDQGTMKLDLTVEVSDGVARCSSSLDDDETVVELGDDVVLENPWVSPHLVRDFVEGDIAEKDYRVFEARDQEVQTCTYKRVRREALEIAGRSIDTVVLHRRNQATAQTMTAWLDVQSGRIVQVHVPPNRRVYLADASVAKRIEVANLDASITAPTNVSIADVQGITYMKVKAVLEPTGLVVMPESLNVPGQSFEGTIQDNRIDGVFEIEHPRYDGSQAPAFPPDFGGDAALAPYLEAEGFIESDDPVLAAQAAALVEGATDCWDASRRLATWVSKNIDYAIPGGGMARRTYDTRTGECGSHSILFAAFCRALGIPARVVWGCMYGPNRGGTFGQHAWNEVYMGAAGWVPIDTTAAEIDFVDSGHIRVGELDSTSIAVNLRTMEVLEHRVGTGEKAAVPALDYEPYLGEYTFAARGMKAKVVVQNGSLVLEIPGQAVLALKDPDERGAWYAKLSDRLYCTFTLGDEGKAVELQIHELVRMQRTGDPEAIEPGVPEAERKYLGSYLLATLKATFEVVYLDGGLAVKDPLAKKTIRLQAPDEDGRRLDEFGKNTMSFEEDESGRVRALVIDAVSRFRR